MVSQVRTYQHDDLPTPRSLRSVLFAEKCENNYVSVSSWNLKNKRTFLSTVGFAVYFRFRCTGSTNNSHHIYLCFSTVKADRVFLRKKLRINIWCNSFKLEKSVPNRKNGQKCQRYSDSNYVTHKHFCLPYSLFKKTFQSLFKIHKNIARKCKFLFLVLWNYFRLDWELEKSCSVNVTLVGKRNSLGKYSK